MTKEQSLEQLRDIFLTHCDTKEDLVICSELSFRPGGFSSFDCMNTSTGEKQRVTFKIEEI